MRIKKKWLALIVFVVSVILTIGIYASSISLKGWTGDALGTSLVAETETSLVTGDRDIPFSNGYRGFCLDVNLKGAYTGNTFTTAESTSVAKSNRDNSDVSQLLKVMFTQCFESIFESDGDGGYQIKDSNAVQAIVWSFTDGQYIWGEQKTIANEAKAYNGPEIPDSGYVRQLENGDTITFYFVVMTPQNSTQQDFFAYRIEVNNSPVHTHDFGNEWKTDDDKHWKECECGGTESESKHGGGTATCVSKAKCNECGTYYGAKNPENHTGETEIRNKKEATTKGPGYTGDTYCKSCDALLLKGQEILPLCHNLGEWYTVSEPTCTEKGTEQRNCTWCDYVETKNTDALGHKEVSDKGFAATCLKDGLTDGTHCKVCNSVLVKQESIQKLGHDIIADKGKKPTCTETGLTDGEHCKRCDYSVKRQEIPASGHKMSVWIVVKEPTCTTKGEEKKNCEKCDYFETRSVEMIAHTVVVDKAVLPTCTTSGLTEGSHCGVCNTILVKQNAVKKLGHNTSLRNQKEPDCITPGYTGDEICERCNNIVVSGTSIDAKNHNMGTWYTTLKPTCLKDGSEQRDCQRDNCEYKETKVLKAIGHKEKTLASKSPTCVDVGLTEGTVCSTCSTVILAQQEIPALGHKIDKEEIVTNSTCEKEGELKKSCTRKNCEYFEVVTVSPSGHKKEVLGAVAPTCTKTGLTEGSKCAVCSQVLVKQEVVNALGHDIVVENEKEPTCIKTGLTKGEYCNKCDYKIKQDIIPALGHKESVVKGYNETCTSKGKTDGKKCSVCNTVLVEQKEISASGHKMTKWSVKVPSTCTSCGEETRKCEKCSYGESNTLEMIPHNKKVLSAVNPTCTKDGLTDGLHCDMCDTDIQPQRKVDKLGHNIKIDKAVKPTCTKSGLKEGSHCERCDYKVKQEEVPALGHNMSSWSVRKDSTCTENGESQSDCLREECDYTEVAVLSMRGHSPIVDEAVEPTCTTEGLTEGTHCETCEEVLEEQEIICKLPHTELLVGDKTPTVEEEGYTGDIICSKCGELIKKGEVIPRLEKPKSEPSIDVEEEKQTPSSPQTGDSTRIEFYLIATIVSIVLLFLATRKQKENK